MNRRLPQRPCKPRSLLIEEWPTPDQVAWRKAFADGSLLRSSGTAAHLSERSRLTLQQSYGMFLEHVTRTDKSFSTRLIGVPAAALRPHYVASYVDELSKRVSSVTQHENICKLRRATQILTPSRNLRWLGDIVRKLGGLRIPADKRHRIVESHVLLNAGLRLIEQEQQHLTPLGAIRYRNGLMVALLSVCPIRLGNLVELRIGSDFRFIGANWWISLAAADTKNRRADDRMVPSLLTDPFRKYIDVVRPLLKPAHQALWVGLSGRPLGYGTIQSTITATTRELTGVAVSPHLFRTCAATTAYLHAPQSPALPSQLLQHTDQSVTQKYYNKAPAVVYAERFRRLVEE